MMSYYLLFLGFLRKITLYFSFFCAGTIFIGYDFFPDVLPFWWEKSLWLMNSWAIFILMIIRPLAEVLPKHLAKWVFALVAYRKELGIFSALIVLSFGLAKYMSWGISEFLMTYFSWAYWSFPEAKFWGLLGELVAVPLLLTSHLWIQKKMGKWWKRIQRLSYLYFFAGAWYVYSAFGAVEELWFMVIVVVLTIGAFVKKRCIFSLFGLRK